MAINIGRYRFQGPFASTAYLSDFSGIYVILDARTDGKFYVLDVGESAQVQTRVANHDRRSSWSRNASGSLRVAVLYTPHLQQAGRRSIEQELRAQFSPACGVM